ncbi:hypothetical protein HKX48_008363 [Thoreauomyces humboldtii]|nr:hypothetical protein HKX48_008363 [Thoreauomyces humboldtii]
MAVPAGTPVADADDDKRKAPSGSGNSRKRSRQKPANQARMKIIVRRLPPNLPEEIFTKSIEKWIEDVDWTVYVAGKIAKSQAKINVFSTAYLNFKSIEIMLDFCKSYNGHLFVDSRGSEHRAVVEFAPFQRVPKRKRKADPRMNTIDQDADYIKFLKSLEEDPVKQAEEAAAANPDTQLERLERRLLAEQSGVVTSGTSSSNRPSAVPAAPEKPKSTPLLDALRAKKASIRAAAEANKLANTSRKPNADRKVDKLLSYASASGPAAAPRQLAKRPEPSKPAKNAPVVAVTKQPSPKTSETSSGGQEAKETKKSRDTTRRERTGPASSLFSKSLGAALGKPQRAEKAVRAEATLEGGPAVDAKPVTAIAKEQESKGRGYKSKRQAFVTPENVISSSRANGSEPISFKIIPAVTAARALPIATIAASVISSSSKASTSRPGTPKRDQPTTEPKPDMSPKATRSRRNAKQPRESSSNLPASTSPHSKGKGKESNGASVGGIGEAAAKSTRAPGSAVSAAASPDPASGKRAAPIAAGLEASKRTGPTVSIMKRDGTSSNFNTREGSGD